MTKPVYESFGPVPKSVAPNELVRRWDLAILAISTTFLSCFTLLLFLTRNFQPSSVISFWGEMSLALQVGLYILTGTMLFKSSIADSLDMVRTIDFWQVKFLLVWVLSLGATAFVAIHALTPRTNTRHLDGQRLRRDKDALRYAKEITKKNEGKLGLWLHDHLYLDIPTICRHILFIGSVGAGKTQILIRLIQQVMLRCAYKEAKLILYDVKGDFTSYDDFDANQWAPEGKKPSEKQLKKVVPRPIIISPYDKRSYVWDIASDLQTELQISEFVNSLIKSEPGDKNSFFTDNAKVLATALVRLLIIEKKRDWCWPELATYLNLGLDDIKTKIDAYPEVREFDKVRGIIQDGDGEGAISDILATIVANTMRIDYLAKAWPKVGARRFSMTEFLKDDYKGRRAVILQGGSDEALTSFYLSLMINISVQQIISPKMVENPNRGIFFIIDELKSCGRLNIQPLVEQGRSKGVAFIACLQSLEQIRKVYGDEDSKALPSMMATKIIGQIQMGSDREEVAKLFGTNIVGTLAHDAEANIHQDGKQVIFANDLSKDLGPVSGSQYGPNGFGLNAIVAVAASDPMLLTWNGVVITKKREGQEPADWTIKSVAELHKPVVVPEAVTSPVLEKKPLPKKPKLKQINFDDIDKMIDL